jgi:hypothetical protein
METFLPWNRWHELAERNDQRGKSEKVTRLPLHLGVSPCKMAFENGSRAGWNPTGGSSVSRQAATNFLMKDHSGVYLVIWGHRHRMRSPRGVRKAF